MPAKDKVKEMGLSMFETRRYNNFIQELFKDELNDELNALLNDDSES